MATATIIGLVISAVGAAASFAQSRAQAKQAQANAAMNRQYEAYNSAVRKQQAESQALLADRDAKIIQLNRDSMIAVGKADEAEHRRRTHQALGAARAIQGGRGFLAEDGTVDSSFSLINEQIAADSALDILNMRYNRTLKDIELKLLQEDATYQGVLARYAKDADIPTPVYQPKDNSGFSLLKGAAKFGGDLNKAGVFDSSGGGGQATFSTATGAYGGNSFGGGFGGI